MEAGRNSMDLNGTTRRFQQLLSVATVDDHAIPPVVGGIDSTSTSGAVIW